MATEFANLLTISGSAGATSAFLLAAEAADVITPSTMTALPNHSIAVDNGRTNHQIEFLSRTAPAFAPIEQLAEGHPEVVIAIAAVEPGSSFAEIRVIKGSDSWLAELDDIEKCECLDPESGFLAEEEAFTALMSTASSVIDDYERKLVFAHAPAPGA